MAEYGKLENKRDALYILVDFLAGEVGVMKNKPVLFFSLIHAAIFMGLFVLMTQLFYPGPGDLERYFALRILDGMVPYRDFPVEYPPLGLVTFLLPALFFKEHLSYALGLAAEMLVLDIVVLFLLRALAPRFNMTVRYVLGLYTVFVLAVGPLMVIRYDILPGMLVLAAVWAFASGRTRLAWGALGLGIAAKIYPLVLVPVFALNQMRRRRYAEMLKGGALMAAVLLAFVLPLLKSDPSGFISMLTYHTERGLQCESTYASLLLIGQTLGLTQIQGELSFGSWNLVSPPLANYFSAASLYVTIGILLALYIKYRRDLSGASENQDKGSGLELTARFSLLAMLTFLLANKVFSPQYIIWLCPLLPLVNGNREKLIPALFIIAAIITQVIFPYNYIPLEVGESYAVALITVRNFLLILMGVLLLRPRQARTKPASR